MCHQRGQKGADFGKLRNEAAAQSGAAPHARRETDAPRCTIWYTEGMVGIFVSIFLLVLAAQPPAAHSVLNTQASPRAVLHGVPGSAVTMDDGFWKPRQKAVVDVSLPSLLTLFEEKGILDNFRRISGRKIVARRGPLFTDSDVYKWLEAVAFVLQSGPHATLQKAAEAVIDEIAAAQEPSGYLNTYYSKENLSLRHQNMRHGHELYCLGHLLQAGIAWYRFNGDRKLLDTGVRMVDYLQREFGPGKRPIFEGHPEIELALVELYRTTGERRYLEFAGYLLSGDVRNEAAVPPREFVYLFTVKPFTGRTRLEGHAVRAMYACSGATDYFLETGDTRYWNTLTRLWTDMVERKQYLTGGVGSRASGEAFGEPYELPNQQAYTESCASIATMFWNWRMMHGEPDAKYMDNFERALYNGANSGLSLEGNLYCYRNPLEHVGNREDRIRNPWYDTTCCPPNLQRMLASLPGYIYSTSKEGLYIHLFDANHMQWKLEDGTALKVRQVTRYPWDGRVDITIEPEHSATFTLFLRRPEWAQPAKVSGVVSSAALKNGYFAITRTWKPGDRVVLELGMEPRLTAGNLYLREDIGKVAVERGPLVYAMEGLDQPGGSTVFDWLLIPGAFRSEWKPDPARRVRDAGPGHPLYRRWSRTPARSDAGEVTLIPYYTFHNRDITSMQVWIPIE
jgi:DUF1680 family protein